MGKKVKKMEKKHETTLQHHNKCNYRLMRGSASKKKQKIRMGECAEGWSSKAFTENIKLRDCWSTRKVPR